MKYKVDYIFFEDAAIDSIYIRKVTQRSIYYHQNIDEAKIYQNWPINIKSLANTLDFLTDIFVI